MYQATTPTIQCVFCEDDMEVLNNSKDNIYFTISQGAMILTKDKDAITKDIILVTDMLKKVKKEIKLCDVIYNNVPEMKQQIKKVEDKEQEKEQKQKKKMKNYEL